MPNAEGSEVDRRLHDLTTLAQIIREMVPGRGVQYSERVAEAVQRWLLKGEWPL